VSRYAPDLDNLARRFTQFAEIDCRGASPLYEKLGLGVAGDPTLLELLARARPGQRRPMLFMAAANFLGAFADGPVEYADFRQFCLHHRDALVELIETRATQTNEVRRSALLLPLFLRPPQPLALIEVGASAGLNLLFDRYAYDYDGVRLGEGRPLLQCSSDLVPDRFPDVAWRMGVDREPVDVRDDEAIAWLRACIWPDQIERVQRFDEAVSMARHAPPTILAGNVLDVLADAIAAAPTDAHLCLFHTHVVAYFLNEERAAFFDMLDGIGAGRDLTVYSAEAATIVPGLLLERGPGIWVGELAYRGGAKTTTLLGESHPHAEWFRRPER
jgi:hypothetical protein